jgi:TIR domain-containing protein
MSEESATPQETKPTYEWDFFLAHSSKDTDAAKSLYNKLNPPARVFLDAKSLLLGDPLNKLPKAQRSSLISIVLVTPNTENAYYEGEEIVAAVQMWRNDPYTHRVIPIYLNERQPPKNPPYGLASLQCLCIPETSDFTEAGARLLETLEAMKKLEVKKDQFVAQTQIAVAKITGNESSKAEVLAGLSEATRFRHSILLTLVGLFVLVLVLLIVSIILLPDIKGQLFALFGSFAAALLFFILRIISRSLGDAGQIAQGRINGG